MRPLLLSVIRLYQKTLSFDHGPLRVFFPEGYCRFYPSCSGYSYIAIKRFGVFRGCLLACWRILRCQPFSAGGIDEPPSINSRSYPVRE